MADHSPRAQPLPTARADFKTASAARLLVILAMLVCSRISAADAQYWPPWDESDQMLTQVDHNSSWVQRTDKPFLFWRKTTKAFSSEKAAKDFALTQQDSRVQSCLAQEGTFVVYFSEPMDITAMIPEAERDKWSVGLRNYCIYRALASAPNGWTPEGNDLVQYYFRDVRNMDEARAVLSAGPAWETRTIVESKGTDLGNGIAGFAVKYRYCFDPFVHAQRSLLSFEVASQISIPDKIGRWIPTAPGYADEPVKKPHYVTSGKQLGFAYLDGMRFSAHIAVYIADDDAGLDHQVLREIYENSSSAKLVTRPDGNVVITSGDSMVIWQSDARHYYVLSGDLKDAVVLSAYLKKFPSNLTADYHLDFEAWSKEELSRTVDLLGVLAKDNPNGTGYHRDYFGAYLYLCKWLEPIPGAPMYSPTQSNNVIPAERQAHFAQVAAWWKLHQTELQLRKNAPLSIESVAHTANALTIQYPDFKEAVAKGITLDELYRLRTAAHEAELQKPLPEKKVLIEAANKLFLADEAEEQQARGADYCKPLEPVEGGWKLIFRMQLNMPWDEYIAKGPLLMERAGKRRFPLEMHYDWYYKDHPKPARSSIYYFDRVNGNWVESIRAYKDE